MRPEYDFSGAQRGRHANAYAAGTNVVLLEPDVAVRFSDSAQVNDALRQIIRNSVVHDPNVEDEDARRRDVFVRVLRVRDEELVRLYEAGRWLLEQREFVGRAPLLAHVVRELKRRLPSAFIGHGTSRIDYHGLLKPHYVAWESVRAMLPAINTFEDDTTTIDVPLRLARALDDLFRKDQGVSLTLRERFLRMSSIVNSEGLAWSGNEKLAEEWMMIAAEGIAHGGQQGVEADERIKALFRQQEAIMLRIFDYAPTRKARILELASSVTSETLPSALVELVTYNDEFTFYQTLRDPSLLQELRAGGHLNIRADQDIEYWPPADYLANIATLTPDAVSDVLIAIPTTPGTSMMRQLLAVASKLPDDQFRLVAARSRWLRRRQPSFNFAEPFFQLVKRLVSLGDEGTAIRLAETFLRTQREPPLSEIPGFDRDRAMPLCRLEFFETITDLFSKALSEADQLRVLRSVVRALNRAIAIEGYDDERLRGRWLNDMLAPARSRQDTKNILSRLCISIAEKAANQNLAGALSFLQEQSENNSFYQRIQLVLIARTNRIDLATIVLKDEDLWKHRDPEHKAIVETYYPDLSLDDRTEIAELAVKSIAGVLHPYLEAQGRSAGDADLIVRGEVASRFGTAVSVVPEPVASSLKTVESNASAVTATPTIESLSAMSLNEIGAVLQTLDTDSDVPWGPTWTVGTALREVVQRSGMLWLADREAITQIPDTYLGWFINGLFGFERRSEEVDFQEYLPICRYAIERAIGLLQSPDVSRVALARDIAHGSGMILADAARRANGTELDEIRELARGLAAVSPTEPDQPRSPWGAVDSALGDPRGLSLHIIAELLLKAYNLKIDYTEIISIYDALSHDESLPVRGALGHFFGWFATAAPDHAEAWAERIFLSANAEANKAGWSGYVKLSDVSATTYRFLREAYHQRLEDLKSALDETQNLQRLGDEAEGRRVQEATLWHIWVLLANRVEPLDYSGSLSEQMVKITDPSLLRELLAKVANSLTESVGDARVDAINVEAMQFFDAVARRSVDENFFNIIAGALPAWIKCDALPVEWRFKQAGLLVDQLSEVPAVGWDLIQSILSLSRANRKRVLQILEALARTANLSILAAIQMYAGPTLRIAHRCNDGEERHLALAIVSILMNNHRPNIIEDTSNDFYG